MSKVYPIFRITPDRSIIKVGDLAVQFENSRVRQSQFRYESSYLSSSDSMELCPVFAPLTNEVLDFKTPHLPGFIDDALPDAWGRSLIAVSLKSRYLSVEQLLDNIRGSFTGDLLIGKPGLVSPEINDISSYNLSGIKDLEDLADKQWLDMALTGAAGSGGARPKLLTNDRLIKFNKASDKIDVCEAEHACLELCLNSGLTDTPPSDIIRLGEHKCLSVERFDMSEQGGRYRLLTLNALLKQPGTNQDPYHCRYEDIADIIRKHCVDPDKQLRKLLTLALINHEVKNTDDHLRNFSLINRGDGWALSPAYDIVPSAETGEYHQLTLSGKPYLVSLDDHEDAGEALGINSDSVATKVREGLDWYACETLANRSLR